MNLSEKILELLLKPRLRYKGVLVSLFGLPAFSPYKKQSIRNAVYKLRKKNYILQGENRAIISLAGRKYIERKLHSMKSFSSCFPKDAPKNLIVMYDIPQNKKAEREWLRFHLRKFGYEMIHKSVWVGPSPLPEEFISYIKRIRLQRHLKALRLAKSYQITSFNL